MCPIPILFTRVSVESNDQIYISLEIWWALVAEYAYANMVVVKEIQS